jgi:hypothetical protein
VLVAEELELRVLQGGATLRRGGAAVGIVAAGPASVIDTPRGPVLSTARRGQ